MHYCYYLFTKNLPSENEIEQIMSPFNVEAYYDKLVFNEDTGDYDNPNNVNPLYFRGTGLLSAVAMAVTSN